ncbi:MAG: mannose-1-phosphate guanylyltransferase [Clostridiales bacterium]|jgi:mannose-1-phosphate guanylyltransferase|nr:mannose-1-phosphate guanylyltransferase [Clostridiales bacterium]
MKTTAVIMAGGKGERFWPKSRSNMPKQFLSLTGDGKTMIRLTAERHLPMVSWEDIYVVTNRDYVPLVTEQVPEIPAENILAEPTARNTAPCVGYAASVIQQKYGDAVMLVLASDHLIKNNRMYLDTMAQAAEIAIEGDSLCTVGITPSYPETGYGYIHFGYDENTPKHRGVYTVKKFVEKPDLATAKEYLNSGEYLWNSGMFVWKASSILDRIRKLMPDLYNGLSEIAESRGEYDAEAVLERVYRTFPSVSIDYGIMEKAEGVFTIPGSFGWDDAGSWLALARINKTDENGNIVNGDVITIGTRDCIIVGGGRLIATVGLEDTVVVDTDDTLLIARKESAQDIKKVIENLKICNRRSLV